MQLDDCFPCELLVVLIDSGTTCLEAKSSRSAIAAGGALLILGVNCPSFFLDGPNKKRRSCCGADVE